LIGGREGWWGRIPRRRLCVGGVLHVPKILVVGQSNGSFRNEKKKY